MCAESAGERHRRRRRGSPSSSSSSSGFSVDLEVCLVGESPSTSGDDRVTWPDSGSPSSSDAGSQTVTVNEMSDMISCVYIITCCKAVRRSRGALKTATDKLQRVLNALLLVLSAVYWRSVILSCAGFTFQSRSAINLALRHTGVSTEKLRSTWRTTACQCLTFPLDSVYGQPSSSSSSSSTDVVRVA